VTDWTIPESTKVIGIGRRPFPGLGIECQGTFNMPDTPISTTAPQFTVLFTGNLIRNGRPEPVVNMPCWIVNGWHQLATFKKKV